MLVFTGRSPVGKDAPERGRLVAIEHGPLRAQSIAILNQGSWAKSGGPGFGKVLNMLKQVPPRKEHGSNAARSKKG